MASSNTHSVTQSIIRDNYGRDPERLRRKFRILRHDPFAFFRGTCRLFYATLPRTTLFSTAPAVLACGDLHLENFGTYKGDNRLVYFDVNDFDEAALAPCTLELVRFLSSLLVAAAHLGLSKRQAGKLCRAYIAAYRSAIADGKPRWIERATAGGMIEELLRSLAQRKRGALLDKRTVRAKSGRQLRIDDRALAVAPADRVRITALVRRFATTTDNPGFYRLLDIARRVAGNGSLGIERYVLLVEGKGSPDGNYLLDLKLAVSSALTVAVKLRQPKWSSEGARVMSIQRIVQAASPALLHAVADGARSYVLKELQPTADRLELAHVCDGGTARLEHVVKTMAEITAWGQLRGCARHGAAGVEVLQKFIAGDAWETPLLAAATGSCTRTMTQWRAYCKAYDGGVFGSIS